MDNSEFFLNPHNQIYFSGSRLPHMHQPHIWQFITLHLADSIPQNLAEILKLQLASFIQSHPLPWTKEIKALYNRTFYPTLQAHLDKGYGECLFRDPICREIIQESILHRQEESLSAPYFVIMPNHIHLLAIFHAPPAEVIPKFKNYTTKILNKYLHRQGTLWQRDFHDRYIRNETHLTTTRTYIDRNPLHLPPHHYTLYKS